MLSNSDTPFIKKLYKGYTINFVKARRMINCDATKRGEINEVVVTNYKIFKKKKSKSAFKQQKTSVRKKCRRCNKRQRANHQSLKGLTPSDVACPNVKIENKNGWLELIQRGYNGN